MYFDPALGLPPLSPQVLLRSAFERRSGRELSTAAERLRRAVSDRRSKVPGWEPVKIAMPSVDDYADD